MRNKYLLSALALCLLSCSPEAKWDTHDVTIKMNVKTVSAGFIGCDFSTNKDAYYLIDCVPAYSGPNDPYQNPKQFMMLAVDSAYIDYLEWRHWLLESGEFHIAPFASHSLQYGDVNKIFTNLTPGKDYWVYAFVVNPETFQPAGRLYIKTVHTADTSVYNVHFDYRIRGMYDYIYPINEEDGSINYFFPYLAATRDSAFLHDMMEQTPEDYFSELFLAYSDLDFKESVRYGVQVVKNDGLNSDIEFELGHTYYTAIVSYDGFMGNNVIYQFTWTGDSCDLFFTDEDNIAGLGQDE
jgi:hypothetical protein